MNSKGVKFILVSLLFVAFVAAGIYAVYQLNIPDIISTLRSESRSDDNHKNQLMDEADIAGSSDESKNVPTDIPIPGDLGEVTYKPVDDASIVETDLWGPIPLNQIAVVLVEEDIDLLDDILTLLSGKIVGEMAYLDLYQIEFAATDETTFNGLLTSIQSMDGVESAFPNSLDTSKIITGTPCTPLSDPVFDTAGNRRPYEMIGMQNAWKIITLSGVKLNKTRVGVLDSSLYTGSTEADGKVNIIGDTTKDPAKDKEGNIKNAGHTHGTLVTHVIAADKDNSGVAGVASILGDKLTVDVDDRSAGNSRYYEYASADGSQDIYAGLHTGYTRSFVISTLVKLHGQIKDGAKVINCSYGPKEPNDNNKWINKAYKKFFTKMAKDHPDVVFVAAAGNEGSADKSKGGITSDNYYPGGLSLPNVITVGALNDDGSRADFSNHASGDGEVTLSAPGVQVTMGVDADGQPIKASGTSFATPMVTGTIAMLQSINPKITALEIKKYLTDHSAPGTNNGDTSTPIPEGMGAGVLQVDGAVLALINDMRAKEGLPAIDKNNLDKLSNVVLIGERIGGGTVEGSTGEYKVTASAPQILSGATDLTIDVGGQFFMGGNSSQTAIPGQEIIWEIETFDDANEVKVTRSDASNCARMTLENLDITGSWDTVLTVTYDTLIPMIIESIGQSMEEMGCEPEEGSSTTSGDDTLVGAPIPLILNIKAEDTDGQFYSLTLANKEGVDSGLDFSEVAEIIYGEKQSNGHIQFYMESTDDEVTSYVTFNLKSGGQDQLLGDFMVYLGGGTEGIVFSSNYRLEADVVGQRMETPAPTEGETTVNETTN